MHILIVDDEPLARQRLVRMVSSLDGYEVVAEACDGAEAVMAVEKYDPEIVLMDVRMPGEDGLEAARKLSEMSDPPAVIFCTAYDQYALEAFETLAVGYLVKPVGIEQLEKALEKASKLNKVQLSSMGSKASNITENEAQRKHIAAKTRKGLELIPLDDIHCFVADQKYVTVYHAKGETLIDDTLKELENEFPERFVRVHRNSLVAIGGIEGMEKSSSGQYEVKLRDTEYRPIVSRRHVASVRNLLGKL